MKTRTAQALTFVFLVVSLTVSVTALAQEIPKDVLKKFQEDGHIIRSGTGESPQQAAEAARFEIAKYFESKISGETVVKQWAESRTTKGKTLENHLTELTNTVAIGAAREIPGIEIAKTDKLRGSDSYQAWAVLGKSSYATVLNERVSAIDARIDEALDGGHSSDMAYIAALNMAMRELIMRGQHRNDLILLDGGASAENRGPMLNRVMSSIDSLIAGAFDVGIVFSDGMKMNIKSGMVKGIVDAGIRVKQYLSADAATTSGADLLMIVEHSASYQTTKFRKREFHNVDWVLSVQAADAQSGSVIDAFVLNDKVGGSQSDTQSEERMVKKILAEQVPKLSAWVYNVIFKPED